MFSSLSFFFFFFFNDTATTEIYTLSLHDALPIYMPSSNEQSSAIRRPWYLTVVAAVLLLWGAGMSCYFLPGTVKALLSGVAPLGIPLLFLAWMHVLWVVLTVVGIGILRGDARARQIGRASCRERV